MRPQPPSPLTDFPAFSDPAPCPNRLLQPSAQPTHPHQSTRTTPSVSAHPQGAPTSPVISVPCCPKHTDQPSHASPTHSSPTDLHRTDLICPASDPSLPGPHRHARPAQPETCHADKPAPPCSPRSGSRRLVTPQPTIPRHSKPTTHNFSVPGPPSPALTDYPSPLELPPLPYRLTETALVHARPNRLAMSSHARATPTDYPGRNRPPPT